MTSDPTSPRTDSEEQNLEQYVDHRLFDGRFSTLEDHAARKAALGDTKRYSITFLLWERGELSRKTLATIIDDEQTDLTHHLTKLIETGLVNRTGGPEGSDEHETYYELTHIGQQELESDYQNLTGSDTLP